MYWFLSSFETDRKKIGAISLFFNNFRAKSL